MLLGVGILVILELPVQEFFVSPQMDFWDWERRKQKANERSSNCCSLGSVHMLLAGKQKEAPASVAMLPGSCFTAP